MRPWSVRLIVLSLGVAFAASSVPAAQAHAVTSTLPVEHHLLQDEGEDAFLVIDGYDLWDLYVRETHWPEHGDGLTFRFTLYGGFGTVTTAERLVIELGVETPNGPWSTSVATTDDIEWSSDDATIISAQVEDDVQGKTTYIELFAPYVTIGAVPGDTITGAWMRSLVDDMVVDIAPGGLMAGGQAEVPAESIRVTDAVRLVGPRGYTTIEAVEGTRTAVQVRIANPFPDAGQHVHLVAVPLAGWALEPRGNDAVSLHGGKNATFELDILSAGRGPLVLAVSTDLGGMETLYAQYIDGAWKHGPEPILAEDPGENVGESPAAGWAVVVIAAAAFAVLRRRA